jgi:drug/metabolite transporter (DMT)-like permease
MLEGIQTAADWGNLLGLALMPTMISMLTLAVATRYIGPTKTSILGVFEPLTAILIGTLLFGEPLTARMTVGIAVCIAAVVFMILRPHDGITPPKSRMTT